MNLKAAIIIFSMWIAATIILLVGGKNSEDEGVKNRQAVGSSSPAVASVAVRESFALHPPREQTPEKISREILAPLLDPAKVATLKGERPINARLYRVLYWLEMARAGGGELEKVIEQAQDIAGYGGTQRAKADKLAIIWNHEKLRAWGSLTKENLVRMRRGASPSTREREDLDVDHVLPVSIVPELKAAFFNLEILTREENQKKGNKITERERKLARMWHGDGLLSLEALEAVNQ